MAETPLSAAITSLPEEELVRTGTHFRAGYLTEQAGCTIGLARLSEKLFADELGPDFLNAMDRFNDAVMTAGQDKTVAREESRLATLTQNRFVRVAKIWTRRVAALGDILAFQGVNVPAEMRTAGPSTNSVPEICERITKRIAHLSVVPVTGQMLKQRDGLARAGEQILADLTRADTAQELKIENLPQSTREFYRNKGVLYIGLKQINSTAAMIFAEDPTKAAQFNMSILYRHSSHGHHDDNPPDDESGK